MAWGWLRYQPDSALARWFNERTQGAGPNRRARRIAIVALARRLAVILHRMWVDGTDFRWSNAASAVTAS